jgi:hypothetical protein
MMGSRGWRGAFECDALSHNYRRVRRFKPGQVKAAKRSYWKRARKKARAECETWRYTPSMPRLRIET